MNNREWAEHIAGKYDTVDPQNEGALIKDFYDRFCGQLERRQEMKGGRMNIASYEIQVQQLRLAFDGANGHRIRAQRRPFREGIWRTLYATCIAPLREDMYPEEMKLRREKQIAERTGHDNAYGN